MPITAIHSYLVHPAKADETQPAIGGAEVALDGRLYEMLRDVYGKSDVECNIDISFNHNDDGEQQNDCRDLVLRYLRRPTLAKGRRLAKRLQRVTTHRSGLGLLFLLLGEDRGKRKLVISRFPADSAILAEEDEQALTVEFLERVFMKSATSYKAALYSGDAPDDDDDDDDVSGFWDGGAVDKQINSGVTTVSTYWIKEFLASDFRTTAAAGTRRLAQALRLATNDASSTVKVELTAAASLAVSLDGKSTSIHDFGRRFGLSRKAQRELKRALKNERLFTERFRFTMEEFRKHIAYASVELDNGGILTADATRFNKIFTKEEIGDDGDVRYTVEGREVDRRLKRTKS